MVTNKDIIIKIRINNDTIEPQDLIRVLDILEEALYESDRAEVNRAGRQNNLPQFVVDASLERLRRFRRKRIRLQAIRPGSFELDGIVTAAAKWVLNVTLGEVFKNGIQRSIPFSKMSEMITSNIDEKYFEIIKALQVAVLSHKLHCEIQGLPMRDDTPRTLLVNVSLPKEKDRLPTLGESVFLDEDIERRLK